jgi:hypothetical protein
VYKKKFITNSAFSNLEILIKQREKAQCKMMIHVTAEIHTFLINFSCNFQNFLFV